MNIEAVRSLLLALDLGSLSAAASRLGVPASTISRRVQELEVDVGHPLVARTGRGIRPVPQSQASISRLRDVLHAVDACYAQPAPLRRLRVTAPIEMAISLLPALLPVFRESFPEVLVELWGDDRVVGLVEGDFDLALRTGSLPDTSYLSRRMPAAPFVVVAAPELAVRMRGIEDLAAAPTVEVAGPPPGLVGRWSGAPFRVRSPAVARVDSFTAALPLVLAGWAYLAAPPHLVRAHLAAGRLVAIEPVELDEVPLHALYPRRHRGQAAILAFIDCVAALLTAGSGESLAGSAGKGT